MGKITRYIMNDETNEPIQDATAYLLNPNGTRREVIATSNSSGYIELPDQYFGTSGAKVEIDAVGFEPNVSDPASWGFGSLFLIPSAGNVITDGAVVTATKKKVVPKPNYTWPIVLGSVAIVAVGAYFLIK